MDKQLNPSDIIPGHTYRTPSGRRFLVTDTPDTESGNVHYIETGGGQGYRPLYEFLRIVDEDVTA